MSQLKIFPTILRSIYLVAEDSPRQAYYKLWIEEHNNRFAVCKESGGGQKPLDRRRWPFNDYPGAESKFFRIIDEKTNPERKSPRKYAVINTSETDGVKPVGTHESD